MGRPAAVFENWCGIKKAWFLALTKRTSSFLWREAMANPDLDYEIFWKRFEEVILRPLREAGIDPVKVIEEYEKTKKEGVSEERLRKAIEYAFSKRKKMKEQPNS
jgi:hypothetical protein